MKTNDNKTLDNQANDIKDLDAVKTQQLLAIDWASILLPNPIKTITNKYGDNKMYEMNKNRKEILQLLKEIEGSYKRTHATLWTCYKVYEALDIKSEAKRMKKLHKKYLKHESMEYKLSGKVNRAPQEKPPHEILEYYSRRFDEKYRLNLDEPSTLIWTALQLFIDKNDEDGTLIIKLGYLIYGRLEMFKYIMFDIEFDRHFENTINPNAIGRLLKKITELPEKPGYELEYYRRWCKRVGAFNELLNFDAQRLDYNSDNTVLNLYTTYRAMGKNQDAYRLIERWRNIDPNAPACYFDDDKYEPNTCVIEYEDNMEEVHENVAPLILELWTAGIKPVFSYQGSVEYPFWAVGFYTRGDLKKFMSIASGDSSSELYAMFRRGGRDWGIEINQWGDYDNDPFETIVEIHIKNTHFDAILSNFQKYNK